GGARDESKALSEGVLASAELVNRGGDMIAGEAMTQAVSAADGCRNDSCPGMGAFGAMSGGKARYNSGSHTDISSVSLAAGFAKGFELDQGSAVLGAFLEYGNGSYDAYNSFATDRIHGSGDLDYVGVGMLGRMDFAKAGPGHAYTEASLRLGRTHNKYDNADLGGGIGAHYKTSAAYYGGHVGAGYVWDVAPKTTLDLSVKYLVTHQNASRVTLGSGDDIRFDAVTSKRTRLGGRVSYAATDRISPYAGAAWDYEFDAKADATTSGIAIDAPSLKGGTGIGELGVAIKPSAEMPLSLDLGLQGYAGKREGVTGSLKAVFRF
ncbi:MAG: autotransporter outer membrane beta-barrel domain-containing protein, partial [Rhodospirillaceae bacterium]|nr:autotransporter outer membrane beta-barrel domain-containing protein [Rhodospirillaceae bacterium]